MKGVLAGALLAWIAALPGCMRSSRLPPGTYHPQDSTPDLVLSAEQRALALRRAQVWAPPRTPVAQFDFRANADGLLAPDAEVVCKFLVKPSPGLTPKFACVLPDGQVVKVKYGRYNAEPKAEVAASRLLTALGFGADRMYVVRRVRCVGCPRYPYPRQAWLDSLLADFGRHHDFENVAVERPFPGRDIESEATTGWGLYELARTKPADGAEAAPRDALLLMAAFLNHWDNKAQNQRLVCLPGREAPDGTCAAVFAFIQDLGSSFGPWKVDLQGWRMHPVWADAGSCRLSMESLPFGGSTFPAGPIGEDGRRLVASLLEQLRPEQVRDLFAAARFTEGPPESTASLDGWVAAFQERVRQILAAGPCPAS